MGWGPPTRALPDPVPAAARVQEGPLPAQNRSSLLAATWQPFLSSRACLQLLRASLRQHRAPPHRHPSALPPACLCLCHPSHLRPSCRALHFPRSTSQCPPPAPHQSHCCSTSDLTIYSAALTPSPPPASCLPLPSPLSSTPLHSNTPPALLFFCLPARLTRRLGA